MIGKHHVKVSNRNVHFSFDITRNITVIRGDSATGKTTLINLLSEYENFGKQSGVTLVCDKRCRVLTEADWEIRLQNMKDSIIFIDEGNRFIKSTDFARRVRESDNYYVIITRESLYNLPYSVEEIYEMRKIRHNMTLGKVYNGIRKFYSDIPVENNRITDTETIITEDSNSGHEFFLHVADQNGIHCISAHGKSNIFHTVQGLKGKQKICIIADGAAFGAEMDRLYKLQAVQPGRITMYLPESFEWLILKSDMIHDQAVREILSSPEEHIDSAVYFSWEQYFTQLLTERTTDTYMRYTKEQLNRFYLQNSNVNKILETIETIS